MEWRYGLSSGAPALQSWSPEFKPQSHQKKKKKKKKEWILFMYYNMDDP
jgi:hypothetical protein